MSQQSEMAEAVYERLSTGPVALASLVRELRDRWGVEHGPGEVHHFVSEVAGCLLRRDDVEVGEVNAGEFKAWAMPASDAADRIENELDGAERLYEDEGRCVFRRRTREPPAESM